MQSTSFDQILNINYCIDQISGTWELIMFEYWRKIMWFYWKQPYVWE